MNAQWQNPRGIQERIVVEGTLILETPTHLGNGDAEGPLDMPLLLDPLKGKTLLTGTSIAGALRNYVWEHSQDLAN
jgi:CRISPR/Cas system CMR subunit Cmr4 (Cas7 group RAMP superfamily)